MTKNLIGNQHTMYEWTNLSDVAWLGVHEKCIADLAITAIATMYKVQESDSRGCKRRENSGNYGRFEWFRDSSFLTSPFQSSLFNFRLRSYFHSSDSVFYCCHLAGMRVASLPLAIISMQDISPSHHSFGRPSFHQARQYNKTTSSVFRSRINTKQKDHNSSSLLVYWVDLFGVPCE